MLDRALLRKKRNQLRLTMRDMAALMGYHSPCAYFRLEHGQSRGTVQQLQALSEILGVSVDELMGNSGGADFYSSSEQAERSFCDDENI